MQIKCPYCQQSHDESGIIKIVCSCGAEANNRMVEIHGLRYSAPVWYWLPPLPAKTPPNNRLHLTAFGDGGRRSIPLL
jgi:hypothetical protein